MDITEKDIINITLDLGLPDLEIVDIKIHTGVIKENATIRIYPQIINNGVVLLYPRIDYYLDGRDGSEVFLVTIMNGKHWWPGSDKDPTENQEINGTEIIWEFFESHPKQ